MDMDRKGEIGKNEQGLAVNMATVCLGRLQLLLLGVPGERRI